jgi:hypothetical protein
VCDDAQVEAIELMASTAAAPLPAQPAVLAATNNYLGVYGGAMPGIDGLTVSHSRDAIRVIGQLCALAVTRGFVQSGLTESVCESYVQVNLHLYTGSMC